MGLLLQHIENYPTTRVFLRSTRQGAAIFPLELLQILHAQMKR
jgi:hypothetical protein